MAPSTHVGLCDPTCCAFPRSQEPGSLTHHHRQLNTSVLRSLLQERVAVSVRMHDWKQYLAHSKCSVSVIMVTIKLGWGQHTHDGALCMELHLETLFSGRWVPIAQARWLAPGSHEVHVACVYCILASVITLGNCYCFYHSLCSLRRKSRLRDMKLPPKATQLRARIWHWLCTCS